MSHSNIVPNLRANNITTFDGYSLETYFKGTSIYFGYQFGVSFKINDMLSVYGGLRYITAKNTYEGYLRNVQLTNGGVPIIRANTYFAQTAAGLNSMIQMPTTLQPIITGGGGTLTLAQAEGGGAITAAQRAGIEQGLLAIGVPAANISAMNINQVSGAFTAATPVLTPKYYEASIGSKLLRDQKADVEQTGSGICPIIGVNITPSDKLNIGIKYEFATKMEVKNKTTLDFVVDSMPGQAATTMFPDGAKTPADMPALLSIGVSYKATEKLSVSGSVYYYFDKAVKYGKKSMYTGEFVSNDSLIDNNFIDLAFGLEYQLTDKLLLSAGYLFGKTGVKPEYNSDLSFSNTSSTFGLGGKYAISPKFDINAGVAYSIYQKQDLDMVTYKQSFQKNTLTIGVGVDIKLGK
jgi:long-subunit fatty acid transport protein